MTGFPNSPKLTKGGIVLVDATTGQVQRVITLQYNPDSLTRSLQAKTLGEGQHSQALRLTGPATETIKLEAEIDATDRLEFPDRNPQTVRHGIQPELAVLESLVHPESSRLIANNELANAGTLEIAPMESPLPLFVWGASRIVPVKVTELSITEEAFDTALNPIRAKVSLGFQVLSVDDLGFDHKGGSLFLNYLQAKEELARQARAGALETLGIGGIQ
jgi:Contractile injection system tube protein